MGVRQLLHGPPPALPRRVDRLLERWARLPPRVRLTCWLMGLLVLTTQCGGYRADLVARWGGEGVEVWQATRTISAGEDPGPAVRRVALPPIALPADPLHGLEPGQRLTMPLLEGAVLTEHHVSPVGLAGSLPGGQRLLPVPIEPTWGVQPGVVVDVWGAAVRGDPPRLLAEGRPVVAVQSDGGRTMALLALDVDLIASATEAMTGGQLLLTLAPRPLPTAAEGDG